MAHGYLSYQDARGESSILSDIAKGIGRRIKKSSDLAAKERRYAEAKAEAEGTSLDEAGVGRGYFFQRALGSSFGGDKIARTRGRFAKTPTKGIDPTGTQASRFRGGFDYTYSETPIVKPKTALPVGQKGGALAKRAAGGALAAALRASAYSGNRISKDETINPDVMGGSMTNVGPFRGKRLNDDNFMASNATVDVSPISSEVIRDDGLSLPTSALARRPDVGGQLDTFSDVGGGGSGEIVQAIDRLTMVTMRLVAATEAQTDSQQQIAANQQDQAEKLAARAKSDAEKARIGDIDTETRGLAYRKLNPSKGLGGLFGGLGGGLLGAGANLLGSGLDLMGGRYMRRGAGGKRMPGARRRLAGMRANKALKGLRSGRAAGVLGKLGSKQASKLGVKTVGKGLAKGGLKMLGKKIPVVGLGLAAIFAAQRAMEGDLLGAGLELASGAASTVPGVGTAASFGLDAALMARDVQAMEGGGIPTQDNQLVMVNDGKHARRGTREAVIPLDKKTFAMFGDGILDSQKRNKKEFARLHAAGISEYYDKQDGWSKFAEGLKNFFDISKFNPFNRDPNASGSPRDAFAGQDWDDVDMSTSAKNRVMSRVLPWRKGQAPPTTTKHKQLGYSVPSNFGEKRKGYTHMGADLGMDEGSPVMAIQDGTVMEAYNTGYGKAGGAVKIRHEDGSGYVYGHLEATPGLKPGDTVKAGDEIGKLVFYPGPEGQNYTHLHLERYSDIGRMTGAVDPIGFMLKENITPPTRQAAPGTTSTTPPASKKGDQSFLPVDYNAATGVTTPQLTDAKVASLSDSTSLFASTAAANPTIVPMPIMTPQSGEGPTRSVDVAQLGASADSQGSDIWSKSYLRLMS